MPEGIPVAALPGTHEAHPVAGSSGALAVSNLWRLPTLLWLRAVAPRVHAVGTLPRCQGAPFAPYLWRAERMVAALSQDGALGANTFGRAFQLHEFGPALASWEEDVRGMAPAPRLQLPFPLREQWWR